MIYVWAAPRAAASDSLAQELRCSPIMIYMHASPSPSSPRPLLHTTTGPICCVAAARALGCLVQLGAAGTDLSSGQSSGAAAGPTASSAGGGSMVIPRNPPLHSPCPQALVAIYSMPAPDEHGAGFDFQAGAGGACLSWGTHPVTTACSKRSRRAPHTAEHTQTCARGESRVCTGTRAQTTSRDP